MNAWDQLGEEVCTAVVGTIPPAEPEGTAPEGTETGPTASLADFRFRATIQSRQAVRFAGPGGFYDAELLKGGLGGLIGFGLQQLGRPSGLVAQVRRGNFKVYAPTWTTYNPGAGTTPREDGKFQNRQGPCRILIIEGREVAVLRFKSKIPLPLIMALKCLFSGTAYTYGQPGLEDAHEGEQDEQEGERESESFAPDGAEPQPGEDPGRGEPPEHS
jgi:hypothetical protein